ncbi:uncharacterized protein LOC133200144 [Saccostrea echinata]|uniref:uncharacterized protein LOC133200144 n=1 Tax=Saccostrea echinata TaxID=191078 RepID=UPI002A7FDEB9|nr:uncharacterized protein LOC133200144 [Saccostrea echinata]
MSGQSDTYVREMVRHVIQNMEDFQHSLDSMVKDLQCLIHDIDTVTTEIQARIDRKSATRCNHPSDAECPRREDALQKLLDNVRTVDESPDLDLSYLQITSSYQRPKWGRSLSFPVSSFTLSSIVNPKEEFWDDRNATSFVCDIPNFDARQVSKVRTTSCTAQLKDSAKIKTIPEFKSSYSTIDRQSSASSSSGTYKEITSIKRSISVFENAQNEMVEATTQTSFSLDTFDTSTVDFNSEVFYNDAPEPPSYTGSYEREMETELENLFESLHQSCDPDVNDWVMETGNSTLSSDGDTELDQDLNTWVSFTLSNAAQSSESSESSFSASESDIINHNTKATNVYGNLIFSDNLVINPSKSREVIKRLEV